MRWRRGHGQPVLRRATLWPTLGRVSRVACADCRGALHPVAAHRQARRRGVLPRPCRLASRTPETACPAAAVARSASHRCRVCRDGWPSRDYGRKHRVAPGAHAPASYVVMPCLRGPHQWAVTAVVLPAATGYSSILHRRAEGRRAIPTSNSAQAGRKRSSR